MRGRSPTLLPPGRSNRGVDGILDTTEHLGDRVARHESSDCTIEISPGDLMMLGIVGRNTVRHHKHLIVSLVGIDHSRANARVRVDTGNDNGFRAYGLENLVEVGAKEGTVALFHDNLLRRMTIELRQYLAPIGSRGRDPYVLFADLEETIAKIWSELLTDPDNRLAMLTKCARELVNRGDQLRPLSREGGMLTEEVVQHVNNKEYKLGVFTH